MTGLRQRLRAFWLARLKPAERWTLTQRNIYIVPTRAGLAFGGLLLVLLVAAINYQLALGYALTFLLAGSALASMHMTHGSLRGLSLHLKPVAPCHAGHSATLDVVITNPGAARHGLGLGLQPEAGVPTLAWAEVPAQGQSLLAIALPCPRRGLWPLPLLRVESRFPFGLFRAWTVWRPAGQVCVYPRPEQPAPALPLQAPGGGEGRPSRRADGQEFEGVRPWRRGDSPRQVLWKKVAHSGELVSREGRTQHGEPAWLDYQDTALADPEARLSRLAAWIGQAETAGRPWGLRLPGQELPLAEGAPHQQAALRLLAEWPR